MANASNTGETGPKSDDHAPNFLEDVIEQDVADGKNGGRVHTRFPPEPNGFLHIGHAKAICVDFGLAEKFGGLCNLRFDDTNPVREDTRYVESIIEDVKWLGFSWGDRQFFASDYFERLYEFAVELIEAGKAYVDSSTSEEIRQARGDFYRPGVESPYRNRSVDENLDLLARMRAGEFEDGACVLRAKIDMQSGNLNMRDPTIYRIKRAHHHRTGDTWCIYPMYDFAHCLSDAIEGITHSMCSLEFENHRPLYDWFVDNVTAPSKPRQIEFARLNLTYCITSKRKLQMLVDEGVVDGWDDPRMPTLAGMRRRGVTPRAIRSFCDRIGVSKNNSFVDISLFEHLLREDLNAEVPRAMGVLRPLKVVIDNYPEGQTEFFEVGNHPEHADRGTRQVPFGRELYIERDDFMEVPMKKWFRLAPGSEVRLRGACLITCNEMIKDPNSGEVVELRCTWDPESRGGNAPDGRRVKGTLHWVSATHAVDATVHLYDRLFTVEQPDAGETDLLDVVNSTSVQTLTGCKLEPSLAEASPGARFQFERLGYFCRDTAHPDALVFNRTIALRDSWAKIAKKG